ncbi:MAG: hypothetical protein HDS68_01345 [Bacteroidales bacterium]|nr:hypothetical protein [Bacteroidales bacterium]
MKNEENETEKFGQVAKNHLLCTLIRGTSIKAGGSDAATGDMRNEWRPSDHADNQQQESRKYN